MQINSKYVMRWMEYMRNNPENAYRFSECFWPSQIKSKGHIIQSIVDDDIDRLWLKSLDSVYIFGGWYGMLAQCLDSAFPKTKIKTIDIDPDCVDVFWKINYDIDNNILPITSCMSEYEYEDEPSLIINTSVEHTEQNIYNIWWEKIPDGTPYIIQGNNFFECEDHIRCAKDIDNFIEMNGVQNCLFSGSIDCEQFERYYAIGVK